MTFRYSVGGKIKIARIYLHPAISKLCKCTSSLPIKRASDDKYRSISFATNYSGGASKSTIISSTRCDRNIGESRPSRPFGKSGKFKRRLILKRSTREEKKEIFDLKGNDIVGYRRRCRCAVTGVAQTSRVNHAHARFPLPLPAPLLSPSAFIISLYRFLPFLLARSPTWCTPPR